MNSKTTVPLAIHHAGVNAEDFDALIVPGGFGSAKNLSNFAIEGAGCSIQPEVLALT